MTCNSCAGGTLHPSVSYAEQGLQSIPGASFEGWVRPEDPQAYAVAQSIASLAVAASTARDLRGAALMLGGLVIARSLDVRVVGESPFDGFAATRFEDRQNRLGAILLIRHTTLPGSQRSRRTSGWGTRCRARNG